MASTPSSRISFAKIDEPLEVPDLLALQSSSFDWLIGSERWRAQADARGEAEAMSGLEEILAEIREEVEKIKADKGVVPGLVTILVGENPASISYVTGKIKTAKRWLKRMYRNW